MSENKKYYNGAFKTISDDKQETILEIVAQFHIRNGTLQHDGSRGRIDITHEEFKDVLSYVSTFGE